MSASAFIASIPLYWERRQWKRRIQCTCERQKPEGSRKRRNESERRLTIKQWVARDTDIAVRHGHKALVGEGKRERERAVIGGEEARGRESRNQRKRQTWQGRMRARQE